jgi:tetratricopeptide (TPR) repeat protein
MSAKSSWQPVFLAITVMCLLPAGTGCDELSARREVQQADRLFYEGRYSQAAERYERALSLAPDLVIGHHNAAINYYKIFLPGDERPENLEIARKAAYHFQRYLDSDPDDQKVINVLSKIWVDSGDYQSALGYWEGVLAKDPRNRSVLLQLAEINRQAGRHTEALEWLYRRIEAEEQDEGKVQGYLDIAKLQWSRLNRREVVDLERIAIADEGIAALQKASAINADHIDVHGYLGSLYQLRSLAHGAAWARYVDAASQRHHQLRAVELTKKAQAEADRTSDKPGSSDEPDEPDEPDKPTPPAKDEE